MAGRQADEQIAMTNCRPAARYDHAAIRRAREGRDVALDLAGVSHVDRNHIHLSDDAAGWTAANQLVPEPKLVSRTTAARVTLGAICLSSSSHFPPRLYS